MAKVLNRKACKDYALQVSSNHRQGKFNRVSKQFLDDLEFKVMNLIFKSVKEHPTVGKTITDLKH